MVFMNLLSVITSMRVGLLGLSLAVLFIGAAACTGSNGGSSPDSSSAVETVYDFHIQLYQGQAAVGGNQVALSDLRGQPVVLNFWAGLCPPCRAEMPEFQTFADSKKGEVLVIGVDLGQYFSLGTQDDAKTLLNELEVTYPAGYTDDPKVVRELKVLGLPATLFITENGALHRNWVGILNRDKLEEITEEMLAQ